MTRFLRAYRDFSGGLTELANDNMPDNMLVQAKNAVAGDGAGIERASGYTAAYPKEVSEGPNGDFLLDSVGHYETMDYESEQLSPSSRYFVYVNGEKTDTAGRMVPDGGVEVIAKFGEESVSIITNGNQLIVSAPGLAGETLQIKVSRIVPELVGGKVLAFLDAEFSVLKDDEEQLEMQTIVFTDTGVYRKGEEWEKLPSDVYTYTLTENLATGDYFIKIGETPYKFSIEAELAVGSVVAFDALTCRMLVDNEKIDSQIAWSTEGATELTSKFIKEQKGKVSIGAVLGWFVYGKVLYWISGEGYYKYDGTSASAVTPRSGNSGAITEAQAVTWEEYIKTADFVEQRGSRWFFAKRDSDAVLYTETGNPDVFLPASILNVLSQESDHITGIKEFNTGLLIFKEKSVHYLTGWDLAGGSDVEMQRLNVTSGTKFGKTICTVDNAVLYLGYDGIYRLYVPNYSSTSVVASKNLSEMRTSKLFYEFDPTDAFAIEYRGTYFLHIENSKASEEYRYDISGNSFWGPFTQQISCYSSSLAENALFIGCNNGVILRKDDNVFHYVSTEIDTLGDELPIEMYVETKAFDLTDSLIRNMKVKKVHIAAKQFLDKASILGVRIKTDYTDTQFEIDFGESLVYGEGLYGEDYWGWKETVTKQFNVNRKAKRMKAFFFADGLDEPVLVYGIGCVYKQKKAKSSREGVTPVPVDYDD